MRETPVANLEKNFLLEAIKVNNCFDFGISLSLKSKVGFGICLGWKKS